MKFNIDSVLLELIGFLDHSFNGILLESKQNEILVRIPEKERIARKYFQLIYNEKELGK